MKIKFSWLPGRTFNRLPAGYNEHCISIEFTNPFQGKHYVHFADWSKVFVFIRNQHQQYGAHY